MGTGTIHVHRLASPNTDYEKKHGKFKRVTHGITLIRDPIARNLSIFFNTIYRKRDWPRDDWPRHFVEEFDHEQVSLYIEEEINMIWGIDVYDYPWIDPWLKLGRLLILKFDCIDEWHKPLKMIIGCEGTCCLHKRFENVNPTKYPFEIENSLPEELIDRVYSTRFAHHFWTNEEREKMKTKWIRRHDG